ncbi:MAG: hypothetical protein L0Y45_05265 [Woeseiaceae bacterium]|nr:hypothetical protein [Woeseiaceae bacterium]
MILRTIAQQAYSQGHRTLASSALPAGLNRLRFSFSNVGWTDSMSLSAAFQIAPDGVTWGDAVGLIMNGRWRNPITGLRDVHFINMPLTQTTTAAARIIGAFSLYDPTNTALQFQTEIVIEGFA